MRSLFSGEICAAKDKFKFMLGWGFEILFSRILLLGVEFPANSAAEILQSRILSFSTCAQSESRGLVKDLRSRISPRQILLGRIPLLVASIRKISYPWIYGHKIPARKISFFGILQTLPLKILQALFCHANAVPRSLRALNFASQNPLAAPANAASENSCAMQAAKFIKNQSNLVSSRVFASLKNRSDLKEASRAH